MNVLYLYYLQYYPYDPLFSCEISGSLLPFFPSKVNNVTVTVGQNAELKCEVENLNNYKVSERRNEGASESNLRNLKMWGCVTFS